jgi:hypothetical protein
MALDRIDPASLTKNNIDVFGMCQYMPKWRSYIRWGQSCG